MNVSSKQKKAIKLIERHLGIKFNGKTQQDVSSFLEENLPKLQEVDFMSNKSPSEKQMKGIKLISDFLHIEFEGKTMRDASDFLEEYLSEAIEKANEVGHK